MRERPHRGPAQTEAPCQLLFGDLLPWFEIAPDDGPLEPVVRSFSQRALAGGDIISEIGNLIARYLLAALGLVGRRQAM